MRQSTVAARSACRSTTVACKKRNARNGKQRHVAQRHGGASRSAARGGTGLPLLGCRGEIDPSGHNIGYSGATLPDRRGSGWMDEPCVSVAHRAGRARKKRNANGRRDRRCQVRYKLSREATVEMIRFEAQLKRRTIKSQILVWQL